MNKAEAKREVARLVDKLDNLTKREAKKYSEEDTKKGFIEPLFRALGWNIEDRREVTAEHKVSRRRVDYAFRIEGIPKFFLEAKPLKADLDNPEYAWQAINYAWTKGVTWAVLTDFEGLKVFNAQWKGPGLLYNRFLDISYTEYLERFDELWLLSRHSFEKSLLDIEAEKVAKKAKREPVGKELFDDLIAWRQRLYRQLRGWEENKKYSEAEIDEAVQRILDRLIFIRTAEDRELEPRVLLPAVREWRENGRRKELDKALARIFREFDKQYDSELFEGHFCEDLVCDSTTYASVIQGLYGMRDEVPTYNFDAIDVDVLGGIYEQYLSYRQGLPEEVEEAKRRRRKKRGIYYTPKFVVQYIVDNTVGRLLQERSHDEIRKLRILDPACGSGSFLIEAFDRLDRYHQEVRGTAQRSDEKAARDDFLERLQILRDNIYGVDLDPQAVEIARLNLLLKTLHRRALLPKLEDNIRCGNSLISGLPIELSQYFGSDWEAKRPFNWGEEFPKIMEEGGFDVLIGNPPYIQSRNIVDDRERHYYWASYTTDTNHSDVFSFFVQRGIALLKQGGFLSYILPATWLQLPSFSSMRKLLLGLCEVKKIATFEAIRVFPHSEVESLVLVAQKTLQPALDNRCLHEKFVDGDGVRLECIGEISQALWQQLGIINLVSDPAINSLMTKLGSAPRELPDLVEVIGGLRTGDDAKYLRREKLGEDDRRLLQGRNVFRYGYEWTGEYVWYRPDLMKSKQCAAPKEARFFEAPEKLLLRMIAGGQPIAAYDNQQFYLLQDNLLLPKSSRHSLKYVLGILNSRLMWFYLSNVVSNIAVTQSVIKQLPVRCIDFDNPQDVKMHDDLVALVERMLGLHKRLKEAKGEEEKNLERQIARTDRKIDNLVYELYGLTGAEIKVVESQ